MNKLPDFQIFSFFASLYSNLKYSGFLKAERNYINSSTSYAYAISGSWSKLYSFRVNEVKNSLNHPFSVDDVTSRES